MKICAACSQTLSKEKFSKNQWQAKQNRRCKECIADNREVANLDVPNDALLQLSLSNVSSNDNDAPPSSSTNGEVAPSWTDDDLFKQVSPNEECPICMLPLPLNGEQQRYKSCCGKTLCMGCIHAIEAEDKRSTICPFCRSPVATLHSEDVERINKRAEANDAEAIYNLGCFYREGRIGLRQDCAKAMELWFRAGELGCTAAYSSIGYAYDSGEGVERDMKKAKYYWELAAMGGNVNARYNVGLLEGCAGNFDRAMKHFMITAGAGHDDSLTKIKEGFLHGAATKDNFEKALRAHKEAKDEMKSNQREAAAVARGRS